MSNWKCYNGGAVTVATDNGTVNTTVSGDPANGVASFYVPANLKAGIGPKLNYQRVTSANQKNDPYGNFPAVCPLQGAGKNSVKLGSDSVSDGGGGMGISTTQGIVYNVRIPVGAKKYKLVFYYAIDLENPGSHTCAEMPFFQVDAFDSVTHATVAPCSNISSNLCDAISSGWSKSTKLFYDGFSYDTIYYKGWTPASIIAKNMGGRTLTMRFTSSGCTLGAHFGYAYVDFDTTNISVTNYIPDTLRYRSSDTCFNYTPPSGYKGYTIIDSTTGVQLGIDTSHAIGTVSTITLCGSNIPKPKSVMQVILTPYTGTGCNDTISYYIDTFSNALKNDTIILIGCNSLNYKGNVYYNSTQLYESIKNIQGYDSAYHVIIITINKMVTTQKNISINGCKFVNYNSKVYTTSTIVRDTVRSLQGCDSVYNIASIIIAKAPVINTINLTGCNSLVYKGIVYTTSATRTDTLKSTLGCDSIYIVANIVIVANTPFINFIKLTGCDSVVYNGVTYTTSTTRTDTLKNLKGCDSIYVVANILIGKPISPTVQSIYYKDCKSIIYKGNIYSASTIFIDTIRSTGGCDSIYNIVTITINKPVTDTINLCGCRNVTYKGITYISSTIVLDTVKSYMGCDSIYNVVIVSINTIPYAYIACGIGTVNVVNTATNKITTTINVGNTPVATCISPDGTKVYVVNYQSYTVSVINTATNNVDATINVGNHPEGVCVSPDGT